MKKMFDTQFAIMEYAPDGTDLVRDSDGRILVFSFQAAKRQMTLWGEASGYSYSAIPYVPGM